MKAYDPRNKQAGYRFLSFPVSWLETRPFVKLSSETFGIFVRLYLLAGRYNQDGELVDEQGPLDIPDIALSLRCSQDELEKAVKQLSDCGLITLEYEKYWRISSFMDEQVNLNQLREEARERQAKHRSKDAEREQKPELEQRFRYRRRVRGRGRGRESQGCHA